MRDVYTENRRIMETHFLITASWDRPQTYGHLAVCELDHGRCPIYFDHLPLQSRGFPSAFTSYECTIQAPVNQHSHGR